MDGYQAYVGSGHVDFNVMFKEGVLQELLKDGATERGGLVIICLRNVSALTFTNEVKKAIDSFCSEEGISLDLTLLFGSTDSACLNLKLGDMDGAKKTYGQICTAECFMEGQMLTYWTRKITKALLD